VSTRNVRDLIVTAWAGKLHAAGCKNPHAFALELAVIAEAHGVKLTRPAHLHDPAADWTAPVEAAEPGSAYLAAKAALTAAAEAADAARPESDPT
jgi:hypothetical protein